MDSCQIRMCLILWILIAMTKKMPGITKGTCHRSWLKCSQTVKNEGMLYRVKDTVTRDTVHHIHHITPKSPQDKHHLGQNELDMQTVTIIATCLTGVAHTTTRYLVA